jgi:hypothetical protein
MNRYVRAALGGFLAILAAFGWTFAIESLVLWHYGMIGGVWGIEVPRYFWYWSLLILLIFSVGFILAFRAAYSKNSS